MRLLLISLLLAVLCGCSEPKEFHMPPSLLVPLEEGKNPQIDTYQVHPSDFED